MDLLSVLDKINCGESLSARELAFVLSRGYADYYRGQTTLTDYGRQVLSTLARAA